MKFCYKYVMVIKLRKWKCKRIALKSKPFKHEPWLMEEIQAVKKTRHASGMKNEDCDIMLFGRHISVYITN